MCQVTNNYEWRKKDSAEIKNFIEKKLFFFGRDVSLEKHRPTGEKYPVGRIQAPLMQDPQFRNLIDFAMKDQKILMQMLQTDPRFMTVFSVLTGIDLEKMNEDVRKHSEERKKEEEKT